MGVGGAVGVGVVLLLAYVCYLKGNRLFVFCFVLFVCLLCFVFFTETLRTLSMDIKYFQILL